MQKSFVFQVLQKSCHFWKEVLLWGKGSHKAGGLQTKNISGPEEIIFQDIFTQDQQVSKIATFGGTSLRIWALNASLVTSKTVDLVA